MDPSLTESLVENPILKRPEGTYYEFRKWVVFVCGGLSYVLVQFHRLTTAVLASQLAVDFNVSKDDLGILASMYFWPYGLIQPFVGSFADILEPGFMIAGANLLSAVGLTICAFAPSLAVACIGRFLVGLGCGTIFVPTNKMGTNWLTPKQFTYFSGSLLGIGSIGSLLSQKPLQALGAIVSWRTILLGAAFLSMIISVFSFIFVRGHPETLGYTAFASRPTKLNAKATFLRLFANLKEVCQMGNFWMLELYAIFAGNHNIVSSLWGVPFLEDVFQYSPSVSPYIVMSLPAAVFIGSPLVPIIAQKVGNKKWTLFWNTSIAIISCLILIFVNCHLKTWMVVLCYFFFAWGSSSSLGVALLMFKEMGRLELSATLVGCGNSGSFLGGAFLQMISSSIIGTFGHHKHYPLTSYQIGVWGFCGICTLVSMFFIGMIIIPKKAETPTTPPRTASFSL